MLGATVVALDTGPATIAAPSTGFQARRSTRTARASRSTSPRSCSPIGGVLRSGMRRVPRRHCSCKRCGARAADGSRPYWAPATRITPNISTSTSYATVRATIIGSASSRVPCRHNCRRYAGMRRRVLACGRLFRSKCGFMTLMKTNRDRQACKGVGRSRGKAGGTRRSILKSKMADNFILSGQSRSENRRGAAEPDWRGKPRLRVPGRGPCRLFRRGCQTSCARFEGSRADRSDQVFYRCDLGGYA